MALPNPLQAFVWGAGGAQLTPEQIARQREIADALLAKAGDTSPVASWTQGAARVADAISGKIKQSRLDKAEGANTTANSSILQSLLQGGTSGFPAAPTSAGAFPAAPAASGGDQSASSVSAPQGVADGIRQTAAALGIDPVDLGTAISYETAGTFDPTKKGPTTQWGQHEGLIQFGEPQRKQFGVDLSTPEMAITSQLGPDGAVAKYLRSTGVKPGMGLLDVYSAINAGGVGKYDASDANNGGAPGTVRDKVEKQMAEHRAKAMALLGGDQAAPAAGAVDALAQGKPIPTQVASADPSIGVAQALASPVPMQPGPLASDPAHAAMIDRMTAPQSMTGGAPMPMQDAQALPPALQQPVSDPQQQVAQAQDLSQLPVMAGGTADALPAGQAQQGINPAIIEALSNPAASEQTRKIAGMLLGQQMQSQDPANQLDMKYKQAQIDSLGAKASKQWQKLDDHTLFDPVSGETKSIGGAGGPTKFEGTGLEAQAWNIVQTADPSSKEYATAYSILSQPKNQLVQTDQGQQVIAVPPQLPAWLTPPGGGGPAAPGAAAVPPGAASAAPVAPGAAAGVIPGTKKPPTEQQSRNGAIGHILLNEVPTLGKTFSALSDPKGQFLNLLGPLGNPWQSEEYQRAAGSVTASIANVLYSLSGSSSNPGEVVKQIDVLTPKYGDKPGTIKDKLNRFKTYVRSVSSEANDPDLTKMVEDAISQMDAPAAGGDKKKTSTGVEWSVEP